MPRTIKVAAAQVGAVHRDANRAETLSRLISLLHQASSQNVKLVLYPEATFTTFFPRHLFDPSAELEAYFEHGDITKSPDTAPLFEEARKANIDISVGFAERTEDGTRYNTCVYYSASEDKVISKYRKVHLPGTVEPFEDPDAVNQLEKRYFTPGNLGFEAFRAPGLLPSDRVLRNSTSPDIKGEIVDKELHGKGDPILGMLICNDRRWPEAWRSYALQGAELMLIGYNTVSHSPHLWGTQKPMTPEQAEQEALFHSKLVQQANSYMNSVWSISAARCGSDDGKYDLIAGSAIVDPEGHVVAEAKTKGDELIVAEVDLGECRQGREKTFDFGRHRRTEAYARIVEQTGVVEPELLP